MSKNNSKIVLKGILGGIIYVLLLEGTFAITWLVNDFASMLVVFVKMLLLGWFYSSNDNCHTVPTIVTAFSTAVVLLFIRAALITAVPLIYNFQFNGVRNSEDRIDALIEFVWHCVNYFTNSLFTLLSALLITNLRSRYKNT